VARLDGGNCRIVCCLFQVAVVAEPAIPKNYHTNAEMPDRMRMMRRLRIDLIGPTSRRQPLFVLFEMAAP